MLTGQNFNFENVKLQINLLFVDIKQCDWVYTNGRLDDNFDMTKFDESRIKFYSDNAQHWDKDSDVLEHTGNKTGAELLHKYLKGEQYRGVIYVLYYFTIFQNYITL